MAKRKFDAKKSQKVVGLKIRELRMSRGWTLENTEEHGWPSWRHLQKIEAGKNITLTTLINISNLFGVHPREIVADI